MLRMKAQVICMCFKENISIFPYLMESMWAQKVELTVDLSRFSFLLNSVKFVRMVVNILL